MSDAIFQSLYFEVYNMVKHSQLYHQQQPGKEHIDKKYNVCVCVNEHTHTHGTGSIPGLWWSRV